MSNAVKEAKERIDAGNGTDEDKALIAANDKSIEQDNQKAEGETQTKINEIFNAEGDRAEPDDDEDDSTSDDNQTESETDSDDSTPDDGGDNTEDTDDPDADDTEEKEADDKPSTLPDSYVRAAVHQGWKEEDVQEFFEQNPELAIKTFKNNYESTNRLSKQFSAMGRARQKQASQKQQGQEQQGQEAKDSKVVDIEELKKQYPDDPIVEGVVKPLNDALGKMQQQLDTINQQGRQAATSAAEQKAVQTENKAIENQIFTFFDERIDMKPYKEFYGTLEKGKTWDDLPQLQHQNRWSVLQQADLLMNGAAFQGEKMDVSDALNLAHMLVTDGMKEQIVREELKKKVKKRSKGVTLKPSKKKAGAKGKTSQKKNLKSAVGKKLKEIFPNN